MLADVLIGLSLWTGISVVAALVLGKMLQRGRTLTGGVAHTRRHALSDVA
jgi:hypothetical protein